MPTLRLEPTSINLEGTLEQKGTSTGCSLFVGLGEGEGGVGLVDHNYKNLLTANATISIPVKTTMHQASSCCSSTEQPPKVIVFFHSYIDNARSESFYLFPTALNGCQSETFLFCTHSVLYKVNEHSFKQAARKIEEGIQLIQEALQRHEVTNKN